MIHVRTKLIIAGFVLAVAMTYLVTAGVRSGWVYFLEVDGFLAESRYQTQRVRLHGKVGPDHVDVNAASLTAEFDLLGTTGQLPVHYTGVVPDTFKAGVDVVVEGRLDESNVFQATVLMAKCASKYREESPHEARNADSLAEEGESRS